jgi:hypothetical protein
MRVTIVPDDGIVLVDSKWLKIDCSSVASDIHAVQWYDDHGEIEYKTINGARAPNMSISDISPFKTVIDLWNVENAKPPPPPPPPPPPLPVTSITRRQLILILLQNGYITADEAVAAAATGAIPAFISGYFASLSAADRAVATVTWASMSECVRSDPMLASLATANNLSSTQLDALFAKASTL